MICVGTRRSVLTVWEDVLGGRFLALDRARVYASRRALPPVSSDLGKVCMHKQSINNYYLYFYYLSIMRFVWVSISVGPVLTTL